MGGDCDGDGGERKRGVKDGLDRMSKRRVRSGAVGRVCAAADQAALAPQSTSVEAAGRSWKRRTSASRDETVDDANTCSGGLRQIQACQEASGVSVFVHEAPFYSVHEFSSTQ